MPSDSLSPTSFFGAWMAALDSAAGDAPPPARSYTLEFLGYGAAGEAAMRRHRAEQDRARARYIVSVSSDALTPRRSTSTPRPRPRRGRRRPRSPARPRDDDPDDVDRWLGGAVGEQLRLELEVGA